MIQFEFVYVRQLCCHMIGVHILARYRCIQGFSCIEKIWARAYAVFPSAYEKSKAPIRQKKVCNNVFFKAVFITRAMHVSEYVLNIMF